VAWDILGATIKICTNEVQNDPTPGDHNLYKKIKLGNLYRTIQYKF